MRTTFSSQTITAWYFDNQSIPIITSKLPSPMGVKSMLNGWFRKFRVQPRTIESVPIVFPSAGSMVYLVSKALGTMSLRRLNSADVGLLSTRFYVLAIIASFALTSGPLEVSSVQESTNLHNSKLLKDKSIEGNLLISSHGRFLVVALQSASPSVVQLTLVAESCETCGGPHHYSECQAAGGFTQGDVYAATGNYNAGVPPPNSSSSKEVERDPETTMDQVHISSSESTARVPSPVIQPAPASKSNEIPEQNPHQPPIPYPSRLNKAKLQDKSDIQIHKFLQMFKKLHFNISFAEAELEGCLALADLGASINLMPLFVWKKLMLHELIPTRMNLELANRSVAYPVGIAEDVFVQVSKFMFPADFVVVDYDVDPRVPLILRRPCLRMSTSKYPHKHGDESINQIDIIDTTCEDHFHEVLNVLKSIHPLSGSPTPYSDLVVASLSLSLTPFGDSDFILEETDTFLALDDSIPPKIDNGIYDSEGDIFFLKNY
ncbi:reverse transcriptase domain-containing protein [Tanacetum coccineum]|uniref:Reverse transcriptase domain-containing protein n=1 Tax=Tanacetum coccineum TaxID=301880 RepID=A0ABQ4ZND9_9ASTR